MLEKATVTLSLEDFDNLREERKEYRKLVNAIAACFEYTCKKNEEPEECRNCTCDSGCGECPVYEEYPEYDEYLTLDVQRLISATKEYSLYGKDVEGNLESLPVHLKKGRREK